MAVLHTSIYLGMQNMVFLGKLDPSLSPNWKYFIFTPWPLKSHWQKALTSLKVQDQATHSGCEEEGQE